MRPKCDVCEHMTMYPMTPTAGNQWNPRWCVYCKHPDVGDAIRDYYEKRGKLFYNSTGFICFTSRGGMTLNIKYSPYWCPMGKEKK